MSSDPKLVERVLKLFALASGTSFDAEASAARAKAEALIARHNITLPSVKDRNAIDRVAHMPVFRRMKWELLLAQNAAYLCGCEVFFHSDVAGELREGYPFTLVGTVADLEACQYLLAILNEQRMRAWLTAKRDGVADKFHSFCFSFARGVEQNVKARIGQLERDRMRQAWLWWEAHVGKIHPVEIGLRGDGRSEAGRAAGEAASLHRGNVGGGSGEVRRIGRS